MAEEGVLEGEGKRRGWRVVRGQDIGSSDVILRAVESHESKHKAAFEEQMVGGGSAMVEVRLEVGRPVARLLEGEVMQPTVAAGEKGKFREIEEDPGFLAQAPGCAEVPFTVEWNCGRRRCGEEAESEALHAISSRGEVKWAAVCTPGSQGRGGDSGLEGGHGATLKS